MHFFLHFKSQCVPRTYVTLIQTFNESYTCNSIPIKNNFNKMENSYLKIENNSEGNLVVPNSKIQGLNLEEIGPLCPKCGGIKTKKNKGKSVSVPNTPLQTNKNILNVKEEKKSSANGAQIFPIDPKNSETVNKTKPALEPQKIIIKQARIKLELKEIVPEDEESEEEEEKNQKFFNSIPKGITKTKSYPEDMTPAWQKYQNMNNMNFEEKKETFEDSKGEIIKQNGEENEIDSNTEKCNKEDHVIDNTKIDDEPNIGIIETKPTEENENNVEEKYSCTSPQSKYLRGDVIFRCQPFTYVIEANFRHRVCDFCLHQIKVPTYDDSSNNSNFPDDDENSVKSLKNCSACKLVYYCDAVCQKKGWRAHHRSECQCLRQVSPKIIEGLNGHVLHMARIILKLQKGIVVL